SDSDPGPLLKGSVFWLPQAQLFFQLRQLRRFRTLADDFGRDAADDNVVLGDRAGDNGAGGDNNTVGNMGPGGDDAMGAEPDVVADDNRLLFAFLKCHRLPFDHAVIAGKEADGWTHQQVVTENDL